jgi:hypothetical protein
MALSDIPGYVQGWRFSDDSAFYNSGTQRFRDLAGYGALNELQIDVGTPSFVTDGGFRGMTLNNTCHGSFLPAACWQSSMILVARPIMNTGSTNSIIPFIFGNAALDVSNGLVFLQHNAGQRIFYYWSPGGTNTSTITKGGDVLTCAVFSKSQQTRKGYHSENGVSVGETAAVADNDNGNALSVTSASGAAIGVYANDNRARFGNLNAIRGNTTATASTMVIFEAHFFATSILSDHLAATATELAALRAAYGL